MLEIWIHFKMCTINRKKISEKKQFILIGGIKGLLYSFALINGKHILIKLNFTVK